MSATKTEITGQNLYEIPSCTICLQELIDDLVSLACGHIFHLACITQHFQYRGSCPYCQKRAMPKEVRPVIFQLQKNSKANNHLHNLIASMDKSESNQVEGLLKEIKRVAEQNDRFRNREAENEREIKQKKVQIQTLKESVSIKQSEIKKIKKGDLEKQIANKILQQKVQEMERDQIRLRVDLDVFRVKHNQYEKVRKMQEIIRNNSDQLVRYKTELESKQTPPEEMAKIYFDMIMIKHLDALKLRDKLKEYPDKINQKQNQIVKLKGNTENLRREIKDMNEKKVVDRKRYEDLKSKYKSLLEKAKNKSFKEGDFIEYEDSMTFNNLSKLSVPKIEENQTQLTFESSFILKKTNNNSFGGLKKTDKLKPQPFKNLF